METTLWIILIVGLLALILWIYAIVDILRGSLSGNANKILWLIVVIIFPVLGALLYLILGRSTDKPDHNYRRP